MQASPAGAPPAGPILAWAAVSLLLYGLIYAALGVFVLRRFGHAWLWRMWAALVIGATLLLTLYMHRSFPGLPSPGETAYMAAAFVGVPTGAATFSIARFGQRPNPPGLFKHAVVGFAALLLGLPVGLILGAIPDAARIFGW